MKTEAALQDETPSKVYLRILFGLFDMINHSILSHDSSGNYLNPIEA